MKRLPINSYEIEITTRCNAACPACARTYASNLGTLELKDMSLDHLMDIFDQYDISGSTFYFCGTLGDAMTHPDIYNIIEYMVYKGANLDIHTNGGSRNIEFWKRLAALSKLHREVNNRKLNIRWNVDGIDTNSMYRVNVDIGKVLRNMKEYTKNGGDSTWYYIEFEWNTHEIEKAASIAAELGIKFFKRNAWRNTNKGFSTMKFIPRESIKDPSMISCKHKERGELFIDVDGSIWPCCFLRDEANSALSGARVRENEMKALFDRYGEGFNIVSEGISLGDILNHPFYKSELESLGWDENSEMFLSRCYRSCGDRGDRLAKHQIL